MPRKSVALTAGYHSPQVVVDVCLNRNESPEPPPPGFTEALTKAIASVAWNRYPDRSALGLRTAIGALHDVGPEQIFAANGSNEVLQTLLLTYGGPGRLAAMFEPTYALHSHLSYITATGVVEGHRRADFSLDLDEVNRVITSTDPAVVFLCSPNNPTGVVDSPEQIADVLEMVVANGGLLCVDEAYAQFAAHSATELLGPEVPLVVSRTYSKTFALAALRLGYLIGPDWVMADLEKVVLPYHLGAMTQIAGTIALDHTAAMAARVARLVKERERLVLTLSELAVDVLPSGANFVLFAAHHHDGDSVWQGLLDRSVLVRNCSSWPRLAGFLRVTVGTPAENDRFIAALTEVLG